MERNVQFSLTLISIAPVFTVSLRIPASGHSLRASAPLRANPTPAIPSAPLRLCEQTHTPAILHQPTANHSTTTFFIPSLPKNTGKYISSALAGLR